MIIHTGLRTDIPAFYSRWFLNRLKEGFVLVRNPYSISQVTRYTLTPDVVDLIGFCTKNPAPMLPHMEALAPFGQYWFVTITPYGKDIEPHVPPWQSVVRSFQRLSNIVGKDSIGWRYDPIFLSKTYTMERHLKDFERMAEELCGTTKTCVISFIDLYPKVLKNFPEVKSVPEKDKQALGKELISIAQRYGITIKPCAEGNALARYGADCRGCMTKETYEQALHCRLAMPKKQPARKECACYLACDIGAYNTCLHLCRYCYANFSAGLVRQNRQRHAPASPFLIGGSEPGDVVHDAVQRSWKDPALSLFDRLI